MTAISVLWLTPASNRVVQKPTPPLSSVAFSSSSGEMKDTPTCNHKHHKLRASHLTEITLVHQVSCLFDVQVDNIEHITDHLLRTTDTQIQENFDYEKKPLNFNLCSKLLLINNKRYKAPLNEECTEILSLLYMT